ncbi:ABC transporter permease [Brevibacillus sp. TJ4]|uniref:ABC transporter permease n=1 Tax=Brevibacillus sp. TJ4 TaxID=3234853 RepID=UPI0037D72D4A
MNFQVVGDKDIKDYSRVESGGSAIPVEPYADISLFASKPGTFQVDGVELRPGSGNDRTRGLGYFGGSGTVTITYVSDDGRDCWEKSFRVQSGGNEENSCPKITVNHTSYRSGSTIEVMPGEELKFRASFTNKAGETDRASVWWIVTKPDGTEDTSGNYETDNRDRERWRAEPYWEFDLPRWARGKQSSRLDPHDIPLEPGKTYHLRIGYEGTTFANLDCNNWEVTVVVKDIACTIQEQNRIKMYRYGAYPNPIPPRGEEISGVAPHIIFTSMFTRLDDGRYDTNMGYYADVSGTWYLNENGTRTQLSDLLAPMERLHLYLPQHYGAGDTVLLEFVTDTECVRTVTIEIHSDNKCPTKTLGNVRFNGGFSLVEETNWEYEVRFGETITIDPLDIRKGGTWRVSLQSDSPVRINSVAMRWYNPDTRNWERERNGKQMLPTKDGYKHYLYFPSDPDTDIALEGLYRITIYGENNTASSCEGDFFVEIGPTGDMENLLIVKSSFSITPKAPQFPGTEATVTFDIKNAGKTEHDTTLAVRWESSPTATMLDVKGFKPGEVRTITIPTLYPQKSEDFIGNINPDKDKPDNERIWTDNRAVWPVEVMKEIPSPPGGGGDFDGGEIGLEIYDSDNRQLQRLEAQADGVWEREPARIRVVIDQTKINEGFARTEQEINANIAMYKAQLEEYVSGNGVQNIRVTATPEQIVNAKSLAVYEPATLQLQVSGPGTPQQWPVSSTSTGGDFLYTGTVVPTQTTWRQVLDSRPYVAQINGFVITMDHRIDFNVSYDVCSGDEEEEACDSRSFTRTMSGRYTITVTGGQRSFEVFEPNATGSIHHTAEWIEYHARDRYPDSRPNDFYAGERILSQLELQPRHRHPVSGKYPVVESAVAWISETGRQQTALQSRLVLQPAGETRWRGPNYQASKLGTREQGVDTPLMGDKQRGFQKDASYAVYYSVSFQFGVEKGFPYANKLSGTGHGQEDYRIPFRIIANAWERQGIRNHSTQ